MAEVVEVANEKLDRLRGVGTEPPEPGDWRDTTTQERGPGDDQALRLAELIDQYLADLQAGTAPDRARLLADHPDLAGELEACLAGIDFIHAAGAGPERSPERVLGDFRICRELGRGGMGAVYEAEQVSLGRRVALKVLRFGGVSDPEALQRFRREAETVARLHHTNIVPIFAVGSEAGVNYYAMQFIDGPSLDRVLRERGAPLDVQQVADWGLQAAEALVHAHARGVIHRDVKPSNLLLDRDGRIWLTDFGLAKRLDDVTLSLSGTLLGTPRYMSPEQAAAAHHTLDHRTDIYSLGATLYELATGRPVFTGATPQDVISQILTAEPLAPRRHRPTLPRDLETILLKSLAKEPARRYTSAQQLANDLRAFQDGRPISARRAHVVERAARWLKRQKRSVALSAAAMAATLLMVTLGAVGSYFWQRSRLAFLLLKTDCPPLVAELRAGDQSVIPPLTVPTQSRVEVPAGDYQLRVSGDGRLSQSFDVRLARREAWECKLDLEDQLLWRDVRVERAFRPFGVWQSPAKGNAVATASGTPAVAGVAAEAAAGSAPSGDPQHAAAEHQRTDVLLLTPQGIRCLSGVTGAERWQLNLAEPTHALLQGDVHLTWPWDAGVVAGYDQGLGLFDGRPYVVGAEVSDDGDGLDRHGKAEPPPLPPPGTGLDLNAGGHSDLLLASRYQAWLLAVSGADGQPLWVAARGDAAQPRRPAGGERGAVVSPPLVTADADGDGVPDVLAAFVAVASPTGTVERWMELISGGSGRSIWRYDVPAELFALPGSEDVPLQLSWFYGADGGYGSGGTGSNWHPDCFSRDRTAVTRSGRHAYVATRLHLLDAGREQSSAAGAARDDGGKQGTPAIVAFVAGRHLLQLDLQRGVPWTPPQDLGLRPAAEPRYADLDGDGQTDLLAVEQLPDKTVGGPGGARVNKPQTRLAAWSPAKQALLWKCDLEAVSPQQQAVHLATPDWPRVADLDGDGAGEVLVPDGSSLGLMAWQSQPWGKLLVLDGRTGQPRWRRQIFNLDQQLEYFQAGPDIDGDGVREVYVASLWGPEFCLFADCLSGRDGATLWRSEHRLPKPADAQGGLRLTNLGWYADGGDGWPQLLVPFRTDEAAVGDGACLLSAGTGRLTHSAGGVSDVAVTHLDTDGVADLLLFRRTDASRWTAGGVLHAVRGVGQELWRKLGASQHPVGDLDGDAVCDLLELRAPGELAAHSARTGLLLWRTPLSFATAGPFEIQAAAQQDARHGILPIVHDLDGDSVGDVLLVAGNSHTEAPRTVAMALSGRTGRKLWASELSAELTEAVPLVDVRDLDGDGRAEIIVAAAINYGRPARQPFNQGVQLWLAVVEGGTGRTRWIEPLTEPGLANRPKDYDFSRAVLEAAYADHDGDRVLDVVLPGQLQTPDQRLEMRAFSGASGRTLWRFPLPPAVDQQLAFSNVPPAAAADLDADGPAETIVLTLPDAVDADGVTKTFARLDVLDHATGVVRWHWQTPVSRHANEVRGDPRRLRTRLRPVPVRRSGGQHWIALLTRNHQNQDQVHVLDETGKLVSEFQLEPDLRTLGNRLWPIDVQGNGEEHLVLWGGTWLSLLDPQRLDRPVWRREHPTAFGQVLGLLPDPAAEGRIVVMGGGGDHSLRGVDARSGRFAWLCVGPSAGGLNAALDPPWLLSAPAPDLPPCAVYQFRTVAILRRGTDATEPAAAVAPGAGSRWRAIAAPTLAPAAADPRLRRPLPWRPQDHELASLLRDLGWFAFYGLTLAVVPLAYLGRLVRRRQWTLNTLLLAPAVAGVALVGVLLEPGGGPSHPLPDKLLGAFLFAGPVILGLATLARWIWQGRWRIAAAWLVAGLLVMAGVMTFQLVAGVRHRVPLQPEEYYSWSGWYWIAVPVFLGLAWTLCLAVNAAGLVRRAWLWRRRPGESSL